MTPTVRKAFVLSMRLAIIMAIVAWWQFAPDAILDQLLWGRPNEIAVQTFVWFRDGTLPANALATFRTVILGLVFGGLAGSAVGLLTGSLAGASRLLRGPIDALFALPKITLVPLFILWFGIGPRQHVIFTALVVFFFFYYAMHNGIRGIPPILQNSLTLMGASRFQRFFILIMPASFGWMAVALKLALPYAFVAAVSTEVIASTEGLGNLVKNAASVLNSAGMFAALLTLLAISLASSLLTSKLSAKVPWQL